MTRIHRFKPMLAFVAVAAVLVCLAAEADARVGGGLSFGSRGMRTFTPPAATQTAPYGASPIQRSMTQPGQTAPTGAGWFGRPGLFGGFFGGLFGAGLLGLLFGYGLLGGFGGFGSILGLLLQLALIVVAARLISAWWQRRHAPAFAGASLFRGSMPNFGGRMGTGPAAPQLGGEVRIGPADFNTFERLLGEIQSAYGAEDLAALRARVSPEMLSYFAEELARNASRGVVNRVSNVKLLQGDLAEAWREGRVEYATVAMRFALIDTTIDRASGRVVEGNPGVPVQATELWTFLRAPGGAWLLSAIQQT